MTAVLKSEFKYHIITDENLLPPKSKKNPVMKALPNWISKDVIEWKADDDTHDIDFMYPENNKWMVDNDDLEWVIVEPGDVIVNNNGFLGAQEFCENTKAVIKSGFGDAICFLLSADQFKKHFKTLNNEVMP